MIRDILVKLGVPDEDVGFVTTVTVLGALALVGASCFAIIFIFHI